MGTSPTPVEESVKQKGSSQTSEGVDRPPIQGHQQPFDLRKSRKEREKEKIKAKKAVEQVAWVRESMRG